MESGFPCVIYFFSQWWKAIFPLLSHARLQVNLLLLSPTAQERNKGMKKCSCITGPLSSGPWKGLPGPQGWEQVFWIQQHKYLSACRLLLSQARAFQSLHPLDVCSSYLLRDYGLCRYLLHLWIVKHKSVGPNCDTPSLRNLNIDLSCKIQILNTPKFRCVGSRV